MYRTATGAPTVTAPTEQTFWAATTSGAGTQELGWHPTDGRWAVVIMNADGSPGITATGTVEIKAGFLLPLTLTLLVVGVLITAEAVVLIVTGATHRRRCNPRWPGNPAAPLPPGRSGAASPDHPVVLTAHLDPGLSRWQWLVKWFLAIPHYLVLAFLWSAFLVVTVIVGFAILFTGRYPRSLFDFTSGVLRWTWRVVSYYTASTGAHLCASTHEVLDG